MNKQALCHNETPLCLKKINKDAFLSLGGLCLRAKDASMGEQSTHTAVDPAGKRAEKGPAALPVPWGPAAPDNCLKCGIGGCK